MKRLQLVCYLLISGLSLYIEKKQKQTVSENAETKISKRQWEHLLGIAPRLATAYSNKPIRKKEGEKK